MAFTVPIKRAVSATVQSAKLFESAFVNVLESSFANVGKTVWLTDTVRREAQSAAFSFSCLVEEHLLSLQDERIESPIEAAFWLWWHAALAMLRIFGVQRSMPELVPQQTVVACGNRYRVDFILQPGRVAIELDGHEFHERTREQVAYRDRRDRDLQSEGWLVLHFSGSVFLRAPMACIDETYERWLQRASGDE